MNNSDPNPGRMKEDWNVRARQNAKWFINTIQDRQADHVFDLSGERDVQNLVRADLPLLTQGRDPCCQRILEIGCGIGRMTRPLAEIFGEVYATDVSGEMIVRGRRRLRDLGNVIFSETNGVDFRLFADRFFDVIFCAYVYQHVPTTDVIRANLADAYRVLRPGGVFKFQTNGVTNEVFCGLTKDTWTGETFGESAIRSLARELDVQMISLSGAGSQYCWTIWRRRMADMGQSEVLLSFPVPVLDLTNSRRQSLVIAGLDANKADINNVTVQLGETFIKPCYVGPAIDRAAPLSHLRIDFPIPESEPSGSRPLTIRLENGCSSPSILLEVPQPNIMVPRIVLINNGKDGGLDIESTGPKSRTRLFVDGITAWPNWQQLEVLLGQMHFRPDQISFVPGNGLYMVEFTIPDLAPGTFSVSLVLGDYSSASTSLLVRREPFVARLRRLALGSGALRFIKRIKGLLRW